MTPNPGYHLDSILVDGVNQGAPGSYNFANVTANRTISAHFSIDLFTISVASVGGGRFPRPARSSFRPFEPTPRRHPEHRVPPTASSWTA